MLTAFSVLSGDSAMRPCELPSPPTYAVGEVESVNVIGLSQTSVFTSLVNHDPSYCRRTEPRVPPHSAAAFKSVVRWSSGAATSTALLKPNEAPQGMAPAR